MMVKHRMMVGPALSVTSNSLMKIAKSLCVRSVTSMCVQRAPNLTVLNIRC